jgi:hypothetical protein
MRGLSFYLAVSFHQDKEDKKHKEFVRKVILVLKVTYCICSFNCTYKENNEISRVCMYTYMYIYIYNYHKFRSFESEMKRCRI